MKSVYHIRPSPRNKKETVETVSFFGYAQNFSELNLTPGPIVEETTTLRR